VLVLVRALALALAQELALLPRQVLPRQVLPRCLHRKQC